jgi:hypothetical protein
MKTSTLIIAAFILLTPFFMSAQPILGDWLTDAETAEGVAVKNKLSFKKGGEMLVDFGNDGTTDVECVYTVKGNQITIQAITAGDPCGDTIGTWEFKVEGDLIYTKPIDEPCEERRGDGSGLTMTRVK